MANYLETWRDRKIRCVNVDVTTIEPIDQHSVRVGFTLSDAPTEAWKEIFEKVADQFDLLFKTRFQEPNLVLVEPVSVATASIERTFSQLAEAVLETSNRFSAKSAKMLEIAKPFQEAQANITAKAGLSTPRLTLVLHRLVMQRI